MGQTLSEPVTTKETTACQNNLYKVGSSCMQGWRINMEDAHTHILSLPDDPGTAFFAVYDGHGGGKIAEHSSRHLHTYIVNRPEYKEDKIIEAMKKGFMELDAAMSENIFLKEELAGATAVVVLIKDNILYCANAGDSRAIAGINGSFEPLSFDHKPYNEDETRRITAAGGWVENNRVNGNLALSRALGDFIFKKNETKRSEEQIVTACPDVIVKEINPDWEFIVMACDGIWDVLTSEEVSDFVRKRIGAGMEPEEICEELMDKCLAPDCQMGGLGCDNMTVVIICLLHGRPYADLQARCSAF